jgi:hypothetical protein
VRELAEEIEIAAPPEVVWAHLVDFASYGEWNPFIASIEGEARPGAHLKVKLQLRSGRPITMRPQLTEADHERRLRWLGHLGLPGLFDVPGLFDGEHSFELTPNGGTTHFRQHERFTGLLVPLVWRFVAPPTREGFRSSNQALKLRAEGAP